MPSGLWPRRSLTSVTPLAVVIWYWDWFPPKCAESPCCMGRRCGRTEPDPCSGSCDADVVRAPELEHAVQRVGGDAHFGRLAPIGLRAQPVADDALPARHVGLHQSAPVVPRGPLPAHAAALGDASEMR